MAVGGQSFKHLWCQQDDDLIFVAVCLLWSAGITSPCWSCRDILAPTAKVICPDDKGPLYSWDLFLLTPGFCSPLSPQSIFCPVHRLIYPAIVPSYCTTARNTLEVVCLCHLVSPVKCSHGTAMFQTFPLESDVSSHVGIFVPERGG